MVNPTPRPLYPRERPGTLYIEDSVSPRAGLNGCGKSHSQRDSDSPARRESLYRLRYHIIDCDSRHKPYQLVRFSKPDSIFGHTYVYMRMYLCTRIYVCMYISRRVTGFTVKRLASVPDCGKSSGLGSNRNRDRNLQGL